MDNLKTKCKLCEGYGKVIERAPIPETYMPYGWRPKPFTCPECNGTGLEKRLKKRNLV